MKKGLLTTILIIVMIMNVTVFADMNVIYDHKFTESVSAELVWNDESIVKTFSPDASFTVKVDYETNKEKDCTVYITLDDNPEIKAGIIKMYPDKNKGEFTYKFKDLKYGVHNIKVRCEADGVTIKEWTDTMPVMKLYERQFMDWTTISGINGHVGGSENWDGEYAIELLENAGILNVRDGIHWYAFENEMNKVYSVDNVEAVYEFQFLKKINDRDMNMLVTTNGVPTYKGNMDPDQPGHNPTPGPVWLVQEYAEAVTNQVKWNPGEYKNIEYFNEPNGYKLPSALNVNNVMRTTVNLKKTGYDGGIEGFSPQNIREKEWVNEGFQSGVYPYITTAAVHPYGFGAKENSGDVYFDRNQFHYIYDNIIEFGGWKKIDCDELGAPTTMMSEYGQSLTYIKDRIAVENYNASGCYFYDLICDGTIATDKEHNFGIVNHIDNGWRPRPAYITYGNFNSRINGGLFIGMVDFGEETENIRAAVYLKDKEPVMIVWDSNFEDEINSVLNIPNETVQAYDMYGNDLGKMSDSIELTRDPIYVYGLSDSWISRTVYDHVRKRHNTWITNYGETYKEAFGNIESILSENPDADDYREILGMYKETGLKIIAEGKEKKLEDVEVSKRLFQLYEAILPVARGYVNFYDGEKITKIETDIEYYEKLSDERYGNDFYIMQYSDAILRYAKDCNEIAKRVISDGIDNPQKDGVLSHYDLMMGILCEWFENFSEYEYAYNFGLISHFYVPKIDHVDLAYDGEEKEIKVRIVNLGKENFNGNIQVLNEKGELVTQTPVVNVASGNELDQTFNIQCIKPEDGSRLTYTINFVNTNGEIEHTRKYPIDVSNLFSISVDDIQTIPEEAESIKVTVKNEFPMVTDLKMDFETSDNLLLGTNSVDFELKEYEEKVIEVPIVSIKNTKFHHYTLNYKVSNENGKIVENKTVVLSFTPVVYTDSSINPSEWDGDISDWYDAYPIYRSYTDNPNDPESYKNADLAIRILKKWDKENLYLLVDVYDDVESVQYSGVNIWDGDCVQVSVDPLNDGSEDIGGGNRRGYRKDDFEIGFAKTALGSEGYQWNGPDLGISTTPEWVNVSRDVENRLTRYFIALPANKFNLKLEEGADVALNVAVNEADVLGRELWEVITLGTAEDKQPDQYYDYKLVMPTTKDYEVSITENALPK